MYYNITGTGLSVHKDASIWNLFLYILTFACGKIWKTCRELCIKNVRYSHKIRKWLISGLNYSINLLYPGRCPVCGEALAAQDVRIHERCYKRLRVVTEPCCKKCGKPLPDAVAAYCRDCRRRQKHFISGHGLWVYNRYSDMSIYDYKYHHRREYVTFYTEEVMRYYGEWIKAISPQCIVPVPISRARMKKRGFNQAGLLADGISACTGIPVNTGLVRMWDTAPQKTLGHLERSHNLKGAFQADPEDFAGVSRCLLMDDIYTTGSTMEACTCELISAGVNNIWFLTLCIGNGD